MRILVDSNPIVVGSKTGIGYYAERAVNALAKQGKNHIIGYYFDLLGRQGKELTIPEVQSRKVVFPPAKLISILQRLGSLPPLELFVRDKADIVFYTNYVSLPTIRKVPKALAIYDLGFLDCPQYVQGPNLKYLRRHCPRSIQSADIIITISEFTKQRLLHHFPGLKARVVITPIPPATISSEGIVLSGGVRARGVVDKKYILFVGTIEPRKNVAALVEAYCNLPESVRDKYSLVLAGGKGWKDDEILALIAQKQTEGYSIIQLGYTDDADKRALYHLAACYALPSHYEGFGMPVLEAMQYNTPVLLSDIPVFHEVAGDAAVFVDKDNIASISEGLSRLLRDKVLQQDLVRKGKERLGLYSWEKNASIIESAFTTLLKDR